jgi:hypothetical protein
MSAQQQQQQDFRQGVQHLARHQQEASAQPVVLVHQHPHQQALVQVQALEQDRLDPQPQQQE